MIQEYSKKIEHTTGLTGPRLWAIKALAKGAPMMVSELARRMYLHPATVVGIVTRLESHGLIKKTRSKERRPPDCLGGIDPKRKGLGGRCPGSLARGYWSWDWKKSP